MGLIRSGSGLTCNFPSNFRLRLAVKENDRKTAKMKTVNSSKSQRVLEFVPSIRPSFLSVVLVLVCGCLWVKNEATNERLISLESRIYCVPCTKRGTIDNLDRMTFSPTKDIAVDLSKKMQTQVSDDGNGYTSGKIIVILTLLTWMAFMYIEDVQTCFYSPPVKIQPFMT